MSAVSIAPITEPPPLAGVDRRFVEARGVRFHVSEGVGETGLGAAESAGELQSGVGEPRPGVGEPGPGGGPADPIPVLALHGWPQHHYLYRDLLSAPPAGLRIIAPDLPGYGWSGPPPHRWAKEDVASDLLALMDALGLARPAILVGHDWGGYLGYLMALREPDRFGAFLALNISHPWNAVRTIAPHALGLLTYQPLIAAAGVPVMRRTDLLARAIRGSLTNRRALSVQEIRCYSERFRDPVCAGAATDTYRTFLLHELPQALTGRTRRRRLEVPTHALFGVDDGVLHYSLAAAETANAVEYRLELVPGCGHFIVDERPALIRERLISLANRVRSG